MKAQSDSMCSIPVQATYRIIDGQPVRIEAEYMDISADALARFLVQRFGKTPIFNSESEA
ncbi:MAG: hypothetical protein ACK5L0_03585 [Candidatus Fimivivens sp.]